MYALLIGLPIFVLHIVLTRAFAKMSARNLQPRRFTYIVLWCSWACLAVLGLTIPDRVNGELHTVLTGAQEPALGLAIGISNPLAIIGVGLSVAAVISILAELRGPRVHEDEILDAYENRSTQ
ncbi:hypothetical protein [Timonella sp. A28]|uniref:hypothetical protein n=1 Tax=Timonella sp. A28 TaxID=3442640 RepID=UPI003EBC6F4D